MHPDDYRGALLLLGKDWRILILAPDTSEIKAPTSVGIDNSAFCKIFLMGSINERSSLRGIVSNSTGQAAFVSHNTLYLEISQ